MIVQMLTTAAGPSGVWPEGSLQVLDDETAQRLIAGKFAEAVSEIDPPAETETVARETADAPPQAERATAPQTERKPRRRKSTTKK